MNDLLTQSYKGRKIRIVDINGEHWFVGVDVCRILGLKNPHDALSKLDKEDYLYEGIPSKGGLQLTRIVNEPGLYQLIFQSRLPDAKKFKKWVFRGALPNIRMEGFRKEQDREYSLFRARDDLRLANRDLKRELAKTGLFDGDNGTNLYSNIFNIAYRVNYTKITNNEARINMYNKGIRPPGHTCSQVMNIKDPFKTMIKNRDISSYFDLFESQVNQMVRNSMTLNLIKNKYHNFKDLYNGLYDSAMIQFNTIKSQYPNLDMMLEKLVPNIYDAVRENNKKYREIERDRKRREKNKSLEEKKDEGGKSRDGWDLMNHYDL